MACTRPAPYLPWRWGALTAALAAPLPTPAQRTPRAPSIHGHASQVVVACWSCCWPSSGGRLHCGCTAGADLRRHGAAGCPAGAGAGGGISTDSRFVPAFEILAYLLTWCHCALPDTAHPVHPTVSDHSHHLHCTAGTRTSPACTLWHTPTGAQQAQGDVRLLGSDGVTVNPVNGTSVTGRLELYHTTLGWGTVSYYTVGWPDAKVACTQVGARKAVHARRHGGPREPRAHRWNKHLRLAAALTGASAVLASSAAHRIINVYVGGLGLLPPPPRGPDDVRLHLGPVVTRA